jgi:hypothetical protein
MAETNAPGMAASGRHRAQWIGKQETAYGQGMTISNIEIEI